MIGRRTLLRGAAAMPIAGALPAAASALSANDARLVALADEYHAVHAAVLATPSTAPSFDALVCRFSEMEVEAAATPADSLRGVLAKARLCGCPAARGCADLDHVLSVADDVVRLHAMGVLR